MKPADLDLVYTTLCEALGRVGEPRAELFLAALALDLITAFDSPAQVVRAIGRAERRSTDE